MIQRKQTLWLALIASICFSSVYLNIPFRDMDGKLDEKVVEDAVVHIGFSFTAIEILGKDKVRAEPNTLLKYCTLILGLASFISIFLYKQRHLQLIIGQILYVLIVIMAGLMYYYGWSIRYIDHEPDSQIVISLFFPILLAWANYMSLAGIKKDDNLVKSYDRIR